MPKIIIKNLGQKVVPFETNGQSALSVFQANRQDWMHACGGKGRCTTCSMQILSGHAHLSPPSPHELRYIKLGKLAKDVRLACQTLCTGDVEVAVPEAYKLPHLSYSD